MVVNFLPGGATDVAAARVLPMTGHQRASVPGDAPTLAETVVPGFEAATWFRMQASSRTPRAVIDLLGAQIGAISKEPPVRSCLAEFGAELPNPTADGGGPTPAAFETFIGREIIKWAEVVRASGATLG